MRLLRTSTFELESFFDEKLPPYAILSHTWGDEEITLQELQQKDATTLLRSTKIRIVNGEPLHSFQSIKKGFLKILGCALQAENDGLDYIWCDTCCIDKTNSTELSEAINSMYHWYKDQLCYAYLGDVPNAGYQDSTERDSSIAKSRWFTRGWTLQELIAPSRVIFFGENWQSMGSRSEFKDFIAEETGIDREVLDGEDPARSSIAKRMSWASQRETTRIEDLAYCLMGLFGVHMPLIYGEKHKAFLRLQTEIMKTSEDHSLFAWKTPIALYDVHCGLLASSPAYFKESRNVRPFFRDDSRDDISDYDNQPPFSMTNRGISISLPMLRMNRVPGRSMEQPGLFFAALDCQDMTDARGPLGIFLLNDHGRYYRRCYPEQLINASAIQGGVSQAKTRSIYIAQDDITPKAKARCEYRFHFPELPEELLQHGMILEIFPNPRLGSWDPENRVLCCSRGLGASVFIGRADGNGKVFLVGIDSQLSAQSAFDDASDTNEYSFVKYGVSATNALQLAPALLFYRTDVPGSPGGNEITQANRIRKANMARYVPKYPQIAIQQVTEQLRIDAIQQITEQFRIDIEKEKGRDWDQWISRFAWKSSALLDLGTWTVVARSSPKFYQRKKKSEKVWNELKLRVSTVIEEQVVEGQRMFVVRFRTEDQERDPGV